MSARFALPFVVVCVLLGVIISTASGWAHFAIAFVVAVASFRVLPLQIRVAAPVALILLLPADYVYAWEGVVPLFFVLTTVAALVISAFAIPWPRGLRLDDIDFHAFAAFFVVVALIHRSSGELRQVLFWIAAAGAVFWARSVPLPDPKLREQIALGVLIAGSMSSAVAILAVLLPAGLGAILPIYQSKDVYQAVDFGSRAVGLSGHPLRLGTLAMLAVIFAAARAVAIGSRSPRAAAFVAVAILNLIALVLSGARGSWLGLVAATVILFIRSKTGVVHTYRFRLILGVAIAAVAIWVAGLRTYVWERIAGYASAPGSIQQRREALEGVREIWQDLPLTGVGPGGLADIGVRVGLRLPNIENEYLITLMTCGVIGLALFVTGIARRVILAIRAGAAAADLQVALAALTAVAINIGTYNMFSWSAGPLLFGLLLVMCNGPLATDPAPAMTNAGASARPERTVIVPQ